MNGRRLELHLQPHVLRWARERTGLIKESLARKLSVRTERVDEWENSGRISVAQLDRLAHHTHTPLGYLFLSEPVSDQLPIPDFRTVEGEAPSQPSTELLETIQSMQRRQEWLRDDLIQGDHEPLPFVGSVDLETPIDEVAASIRSTLGLTDGWAKVYSNWIDALRSLRVRIEAAGVMVVINGIVGNNTHRALDPNEFRGFSLADEYAPLIFINGADFTSAQMFTLIHELAHLWIAESGVSTFDAMRPIGHRVEIFCDAVAAEVLVPAAELRSIWGGLAQGSERYQALARTFKVSTIVAARRALDLQLISRQEFFGFYDEWEAREIRGQTRGRSGGSFWNTQRVRIGDLFGNAVVRAVKEDRLLYRDAYSLTGLKGKTFDTFVQQMESEL